MKNTLFILCVFFAGFQAAAQTPVRPPVKTYPPRQTLQTSTQPEMIRVVRKEPEIIPYDEEGYPNPDAFDWTGLALGVDAGTLGLGAEVQYHITKWLNIKAAGHTMSFTYKDTFDGIDYTFDMDFTGVGLFLDLYPGPERSFRFSGGFMFQDHVIPVKGDVRGNFSDELVVNGKAEFDSTAPYLGIGFGNPVKPDSALTLTFDIGVILQDYSFDLVATGPGSDNPIIQAAVEETKSDVEDVLDLFTIYPVITLGLHYHF